MAENYGSQPAYWSTESAQEYQMTGQCRPPLDDINSNNPEFKMYWNAVYYPNWRVYRNQPPSSLNFDIVSHVFYAFAWVKPDGTIHCSDEWADTQIEVDGTQGCLNSFSEIKKKYRRLRVVMSVGGGGQGSQTFAEVARSRSSRERFAQSAKEFVEKYNLDGIDIDWEHPSNSAQGEDYVRLLAILRTYLPPPYTLTSALPAGEWALQHINLAEAASYLDLINLMTYDFSGSWVDKCGHHAQLYTPQVPHCAAASLSCHSAVSYLVKNGVPTYKILMGIPAYGRSFLSTRGVGHSYSGHAGEEGTFEYKDLPRPGAEERVDHQVGAAFCVGGDGGFVSYDTPQTVKMKARYVRTNGLGGLFYWTGTGDAKDYQRSLVYNGYVGLHPGQFGEPE